MAARSFRLHNQIRCGKVLHRCGSIRQQMVCHLQTAGPWVAIRKKSPYGYPQQQYPTATRQNGNGRDYAAYPVDRSSVISYTKLR
jgi:hypothetical protein